MDSGRKVLEAEEEFAGRETKLSARAQVRLSNIFWVKCYGSSRSSEGFNEEGQAHEKTCHWPLPPMLPQEEPPSNADLKRV